MATTKEIMVNGVVTSVTEFDHSAQEIDDAIGRALPGGEIDTLLARKAPSTYLGNISRNKIYKIGYFFKGSGASSSGAVTIRIRNFTDYGKENYMLAFLGAYGFSIEYHGQITTTYTSKISVYSDTSVTGSAKKYTVFVTTQNYVDWASVYIDNEHSFTRNFADVTDTFSALVDGLDKVWESEYEYLNPPMQLGVEYRTTERYNGKPVYKVALETGALTIPGNTIVRGTWDTNCTVIGVDAYIRRADESVSNLPNFETASDMYARFWANNLGQFVVKSYTGLTSGATVKAEIRYIKN